jgi:hypothetical protein
MAESTIWWLLTVAAVAVELVTGTFYLLMLAIGLAAAAAHWPAGTSNAAASRGPRRRPTRREPRHRARLSSLTQLGLREWAASPGVKPDASRIDSDGGCRTR